jgi:hypothetical protein
MTSAQKKILRQRVRTNVSIRKQELKKLLGAGTRFHLRADRLFKVACSNLKKEIRLYQRLGSKIR